MLWDQDWGIIIDQDMGSEQTATIFALTALTINAAALTNNADPLTQASREQSLLCQFPCLVTNLDGTVGQGQRLKTQSTQPGRYDLSSNMYR